MTFTQETGPTLLARRTRPLRTAVLLSATGTNLTSLCQMQEQHPDTIRLVLAISDGATSPALEVARRHQIETWPGSFKSACGSWRECQSAFEEAEYRQRAQAYHDCLTDRIESFEAVEGEIDLVVLTYHRWIHGRFLTKFHRRIINQHPGDLTRLGPDGSRLYTGRDPVGLALRSGEAATRTATILVDETHDGRPNIGTWANGEIPRAAATL